MTRLKTNKEITSHLNQMSNHINNNYAHWQDSKRVTSGDRFLILTDLVAKEVHNAGKIFTWFTVGAIDLETYNLFDLDLGPDDIAALIRAGMPFKGSEPIGYTISRDAHEKGGKGRFRVIATRIPLHPALTLELINKMSRYMRSKIRPIPDTEKAFNEIKSQVEPMMESEKFIMSHPMNEWIKIKRPKHILPMTFSRVLKNLVKRGLIDKRGANKGRVYWIVEKEVEEHWN